MGLRVNTNVFSLNAQRNLSAVTERVGGNFSRLSSGLRIASASDDAAGLGISERLRSQVRSLGQAGRNAQDGISLTQVAEGALNEVGTNLNRLRELAVQSANGTLGQEDRDIIDVEFQSLVEEIDRISSDTEFNGISLLDGSTATSTIQVGTEAGQTITIANQDATAATLGIDAADVLSDTNASDALAVIDTAIDTLNTARGSLGSTSNRLSSAFRSIQSTREGLAAAESRIRDGDVAAETADLTRNSILQQAATSVLAQANTQPQLALSLI